MSVKCFSKMKLLVNFDDSVSLTPETIINGKLRFNSDKTAEFFASLVKKRHRTPSIFQGDFMTCHLLQDGSYSITVRVKPGSIKEKKKVQAEIGQAFKSIEEYIEAKGGER